MNQWTGNESIQQQAVNQWTGNESIQQQAVRQHTNLSASSVLCSRHCVCSFLQRTRPDASLIPGTEVGDEFEESASTTVSHNSTIKTKSLLIFTFFTYQQLLTTTQLNTTLNLSLKLSAWNAYKSSWIVTESRSATSKAVVYKEQTIQTSSHHFTSCTCRTED